MSSEKDYVPILVYSRLAPVRQSSQTKDHRTSGGVSSLSSVEALPYQVEDGTMTISDTTTGAFVQVAFENVFEQDATQEHVFESVARPLMSLVKDGYNAVLLAYGQTSSGKTHTMMGPNGGDARYLRDHERGIIPRVIEELLSNRKDHSSYVDVSYLEIYNEVATDLIAKVRSAGDASTYSYRGTERNRIERSTVRVRCHSSDECMAILEEVSSIRRVGSTEANLVSSRSHVIIQIRYGGGGKISLVDLAGSECIKKSNPKGMRLNETRNINTSLFALKKVIHSLYKKDIHIPYKDSILTAVLEDSLGGNSVTALLVSCSMKLSDISETIATLRFAAEASCVKSRPRRASTASAAPPPLAAQKMMCPDRESNVSSHEEEIDSLRQMSHRLTREKEGLHEENMMLSEQCSTAAREREVVEQRVQSLQAEMLRIFDLIDAVKVENESLKQARANDSQEQSVLFDSLQQEITSLQHSLQEQRHHKEQALSLRKEVEILRVENERLSLMLADRTKEIEGGGREAQRLEKQCDRLTEEYSIMAGMLSDATQSVEILQRQLTEERSQGVALKEENTRLKEHVRQLQRVNEQVSIENRRVSAKQLQHSTTVRAPFGQSMQQQQQPSQSTGPQKSTTLTYFESPSKENSW